MTRVRMFLTWYRISSNSRLTYKTHLIAVLVQVKALINRVPWIHSWKTFIEVAAALPLKSISHSLRTRSCKSLASTSPQTAILRILAPLKLRASKRLQHLPWLRRERLSLPVEATLLAAPRRISTLKRTMRAMSRLT